VKRSASTRPGNTPPEAPSDDPAARRRAFENEKANTRALERKRKRVKELETEIAAGEIELERRRDELKQDPNGDWSKLAGMAREEQALAKKVEAAMAEWMGLSEELGATESAGGDA
jgi:ATP-binding cassette, subfamily F, member 3